MIRARSVRRIAAFAVLAAAVLGPAPARASFDPTAPPAGVHMQTEGPRYWVGRIDLSYASEHALQPPLEMLLDLEYALGRASDGFVGARRGGRNEWFHLDGLAAQGPVPVYASGLHDLCEQIVLALGERGLIGVYVAPLESEIDPASGADLREDGRTDLHLRIHTGRIQAVRTFAAAPAAPAVELANGERAAIAAQSPLQPVGAGDPLDKNELDAYLANLNRHPGRMVDVVVTPTLTPGVVNLDYLVAEDRPWTVSSGIANNGTDQSGDYRQRFGFANYQLTGRDDVLRADFVTASLDDMNAGFASYEAPVPGVDRLRWRLNASASEYSADQFGEDDLFEGEQYELGAGVIANLLRSRNTFVDASGGVRWMHIDITNFGVFDSDMPFLVPELAVSLERRMRASRLYARLAYEMSLPSLAGTDSDDIEEFSLAGRQDLDDDWRLVSVDVAGNVFLVPYLRGTSVWHDRPLRPRDIAHEIAWRVGGQYSLGTRLIPQVQGVLGGAATVRGYPQSIVSGDSMFGGSLEYRYHVPMNLRASQPYLVPLFGEFRASPDPSYRRPDWDLVIGTFFDYGFTWNTSPVIGEEDEQLASLGLAFELLLRSNLSLRLDYGFALIDVDSADVESGDTETHLSATVRY